MFPNILKLFKLFYVGWENDNKGKLRCFTFNPIDKLRLILNYVILRMDISSTIKLSYLS